MSDDNNIQDGAGEQPPRRAGRGRKPFDAKAGDFTCEAVDPNAPKPGCNHDHGLHGSAHYTDVHMQAPMREEAKGFRAKIARAIDDTKSRVLHGIDPTRGHVHGQPDGHTHFHPSKVPTAARFGIVAGAMVSLGVALHGIQNTLRGTQGFEDTELGEKYAPSASRTVFGVGEFAGGLALAKRLLTGQFRF